MNGKKAFLLFDDLADPFLSLSDEDAGKLIKNIFLHRNGGSTHKLLPSADMAFAFIKQQIDRSEEAYEGRCERNRQNIQNYWDKVKGKDTTVYERIPPDTNVNDPLRADTVVNDGYPPSPKPSPNPSPDSDKEEDTLSSRASYAEVIQYLNEKANTHFSPTSKDTQRKIKARWNAGYRLPDFKKVIDIKVEQWLTNPEMVSYLRPITLFGPKFESYLNERQHEEKQNKPRERKSLGMCPDCKADLYHDPRIEKTEVMCCRCERIYLFDEFGGLERVTEYGEEKA